MCPYNFHRIHMVGRILYVQIPEHPYTYILTRSARFRLHYSKFSIESYVYTLLLLWITIKLVPEYKRNLLLNYGSPWETSSFLNGRTCKLSNLRNLKLSATYLESRCNSLATIKIGAAVRKISPAKKIIIYNKSSLESFNYLKLRVPNASYEPYTRHV